MKFQYIDMDHWDRKAHFDYYRQKVKTNYTVSANVDITELDRVRKNRFKFYPAFLYVVGRAVNQNFEFRMSLDSDGKLGYYDVCHPSYTIFHEDDKTFSDIWTAYSAEFSDFYRSVTEDIETYRHVKGVKTKEGRPDNFFPVSGVPWLSFTSCSNDTFDEPHMLFPVITFGKYFQDGKRILVPVSVFINHMVADGYHVCKLINDMETIAANAEEWMGV